MRIESPAQCDRSPPGPTEREAVARDRRHCHVSASIRDTNRLDRYRDCSTCPGRGREIEA